METNVLPLVNYQITGSFNGVSEIEQLFANEVPTEAGEPKERFTLTWASQVYEASEPLSFLVDGLLTKGSVNLLVGEGGSKKTWAALDLAVCVATGKDWLNFTVEQSPVLIVDEESGERRLRRRLYETLNGHLVTREENVPVAFTSLSMTNLRDIEDVNALRSMIRLSGAGLVIIDALADVMLGADENSVKDVQPVFMNLRKVAEDTQAAIIVIHHSNKQNGSYRGSTAIKGAVDLMLMCESAPDSKFINFKADKARDIEPKSFAAVANFTVETEQFWLSACDVKPVTKKLGRGEEYVLGYLLKYGNSELDVLVNSPEATCTPNTAKAAYYKLVKSQHVVRTDGGGIGRGVKAVVELTPAGRELAESAK